MVHTPNLSISEDDFLPPLILLGGGGHAQAVAETVLAEGRYRLVGYIDYSAQVAITDNIPYLGDYSEIPALIAEHGTLYALIGIGSGAIRRKEQGRWPDLKWATAVHPTAYVSQSACLGPGTVVLPRAVVHSRTRVGSHCIVNTGAIVEHDNTFGDYSHLGPGAVTGGGVRAGAMVFIGLNATVLPGLILPENTVLGAGATLIHSPESSGTYVGCPAKPIAAK